MADNIGIYKITSPSGKVYIGQTRDLKQRMKFYRLLKCHLQTIIFRSLVKYGYDSHEIKLVHELPEDVDQIILDRFEQTYMDLYRDAGIMLMNVREAGSNGKLGKESIEKMRKALTGRKLPESTREKMRQRMMGKKIGLGNKHTDEWKKQSSKLHKGKKHALGAKHSEEMNERKRNYMLNMPDEHRKNVSEGTRLWWAKRKNKI